MERATLGNPPLSISRIGLGCEPLGGTDWGEVDESKAILAVKKSLELGINVFDTADIYGLGRSEELLSVALGPRRHDAVIVTKFGHRWQTAKPGVRSIVHRDISPRQAREAVESSLRRLRIDSIPIYMVHWPDGYTQLDTTIEALAELQMAGKIRHIGVSNFSEQMLRQASSVAPIAAVEIPYNLINRAVENSILPTCMELGLGVIAYSSLAQGFLTGKFSLNSRFEENDRRSRTPLFRPEAMARHSALLSGLKQTAAKYEKTVSQMAIRWVLDHPAVTCAVIGAKSPAQVLDNAGTADWHISKKDRHDLSEWALS